MSTMKKHIAFAAVCSRILVIYVHNYKVVANDYSSVGSALVDLFSQEEIASFEKHFVSFASVHGQEYDLLIKQVREYNSDRAVDLMELPSARIRFITPLMMNQNRVFHVLKKNMDGMMEGYVDSLRDYDQSREEEHYDAMLQNERDIEDERNPIYAGLSHDAWKSCALDQAMQMDMDPDEKECGCRGKGWLLSQFDTYHECNYHRGRRHPEDQDQD